MTSHPLTIRERELLDRVRRNDGATDNTGVTHGDSYYQRDAVGSVTTWRVPPVADPPPTWLEGLRTPALALVVIAVLCIGLSLVALSAAMDLQRTLALGKAGMADQQQARR